jgi:hypothetical protein
MKKQLTILIVILIGMLLVGCNEAKPEEQKFPNYDDQEHILDRKKSLNNKELTDFYTIEKQFNSQATKNNQVMTTTYVYATMKDLHLSRTKMEQVVNDIIVNTTKRHDFNSEKVVVLLNDSSVLANSFNHSLGYAISEINDSQPASTVNFKYKTNLTLYDKDFSTKPTVREYSIYQEFLTMKSEYSDRYFDNLKYFELTELLGTIETTSIEVNTTVDRVENWINDKDLSDSEIYE